MDKLIKQRLEGKFELIEQFFSAIENFDRIAIFRHEKPDYDVNKTLRGKEGQISKPDSKIKVVIIPTDEEVMIARDTFAFYKK